MKTAKRVTVAPVEVRASVGITVPVFGALDPLGAMAEKTAVALQEAGTHVDVTAGEFRSYASAFRAEPDVDPTSIDLTFLDPDLWRRASRRIAGFITTPTSIAPASWELPLRRADAVIAPSTWIADAIAPYAAGRTSLVPFGIDPAFTFAPKTRGARFRALFCLSPGQELRKGWDVALAAFTAAFSDREDVELIVRSPLPLSFDANDARVRFDIGRRTVAEMADLYRLADVLLHPARAESFGFTPLEAMACGTPAIFSGATGMADYAELGLTVEHRPVPGLNGVGEWREPLVHAIADRLRACYAAHDAEKAARDAAEIVRRYRPDTFAKNLLRALA